MPFWWRRRNKYWRGNRRPFYKRKKYYRRRKRRVNRRSYRRTNKRHRRRRTKVRRKKKTLPIRQWQPQSIRKCKIKGHAVHVLGGEGRQFACYTDSKYDWNLPTTPGGGGFGVEIYTLQTLYNEYKRQSNVWTATNQLLDLCRYTGCTIKMFRHPHLDFIGSYSREYPMQLEKYTYASTHPKTLFLSKHHFIVPSYKTKPLLRKRYIKIRIKPPRQMSNKWFFQQTMATTPLFTLQTAVCDLAYSHLGCCNSNELVSFFSINNQFYTHKDWGNNTNNQPYMPYTHTWGGTFTGKNWLGTTKTGTLKHSTYDESVSYKYGFFQSSLIQCTTMQSPQQVAPIVQCRYNPTIDTGKGNKVWVTSLFKPQWGPPSTDPDLIVENLPLYQLLFGFLSYVTNIKKDKYFLKSYLLCFSCPYIEPQVGTGHYFAPIDQTFLLGQNPYNRFSVHNENDKWFPNITNQLESINAIVQCGPYIPKLDNQRQSTWELQSHYTFYFKWGGAQPPDYTAADPSQQARYDVPDKILQALQISNPTENAKKILHSWDFRRGFVTGKALKRIYENTESDSDSNFSADSTAPAYKMPKPNTLQNKTEDQEEEETCLLSLYKEPTYQEEAQTTNQLIQQQQLQQQHIKEQLLKLISNLKKKQEIILLQTGLLG